MVRESWGESKYSGKYRGKIVEFVGKMCTLSAVGNVIILPLVGGGLQFFSMSVGGSFVCFPYFGAEKLPGKVT